MYFVKNNNNKKNLTICCFCVINAKKKFLDTYVMYSTDLKISKPALNRLSML